MDSLVDPSGDFLFDSVATIVSAVGTEERAPHTDDERVRRRPPRRDSRHRSHQPFIMPGRHVARPGKSPRTPTSNWDPNKSKRLINKDRAKFTALAHGLNDRGHAQYKAIEAKDVAGAVEC
jgi:hypothetical protein